MKVRSVAIKVIDQYGNLHTETFVEGANGVVGLHYIVRDGMVCANALINGNREGYSIPVDRVVSVRTVL